MESENVGYVSAHSISIKSEELALAEKVVHEAWHKLRPLPKAVFYFSTWEELGPDEIVELFAQRGRQIGIDRVGRAYWDAWHAVVQALKAAQLCTAASPRALRMIEQHDAAPRPTHQLRTRH